MNTEKTKEMQAVLDKIKEYKRIIICRHIRPDGDAVGSTMGLKTILSLTFPRKRDISDKRRLFRLCCFSRKRRRGYR